MVPYRIFRSFGSAVGRIARVVIRTKASSFYPLAYAPYRRTACAVGPLARVGRREAPSIKI
jgi:hypothetical protein